MNGLVSFDLTRGINKLKSAGEKGERYAKAIVQGEAQNMVALAKKTAPADLGSLRQSIGKESLNNDYAAAIFVNVPYAAYVEFGTGTKVNIPAELAELAAKFRGKGNGSFNEFKVAITDWMGRKGIDKKYAYVIMMQILHDGLRPQPFFYPAYQKMRADLPKKLKLAFKKI